MTLQKLTFAQFNLYLFTLIFIQSCSSVPGIAIVDRTKKELLNKGQIVSHVVEYSSGKSIVGVSVVVKNENDFTDGAVTDYNGECKISNLPVGVYSIRASEVGWLPCLDSGIVLHPNEEIMLKIKLKGAAEDIEVEITHLMH